MSAALPLSGDRVCARGHRWRRLAACPVCGAAPQTAADRTALDPGDGETLPADAFPRAVSALSTLKVPRPIPAAPPANLPTIAGYETLHVLG